MLSDNDLPVHHCFHFNYCESHADPGWFIAILDWKRSIFRDFLSHNIIRKWLSPSVRPYLCAYYSLNCLHSRASYLLDLFGTCWELVGSEKNFSFARARERPNQLDFLRWFTQKEKAVKARQWRVWIHHLWFLAVAYVVPSLMLSQCHSNTPHTWAMIHVWHSHRPFRLNNGKEKIIHKSSLSSLSTLYCNKRFKNKVVYMLQSSHTSNHIPK